MKAIVIGAGPSGLLAAYLLAKQGYEVTVLEQDTVIGGRLKADVFPDGSTYAVGATWIHNSEHPIANILGKGVDQKDLSADELLKEPHVFVEIVHKTLMDTLKETKDFAERREIADLTWPTLIQLLESTENPQETVYLRTLKPHYIKYLKKPLQEMADAYNQNHKLPALLHIKTLIGQEDFFNSLGFEELAMDDSVLADQHYADPENLGSTTMIPQRGFHHLIQYLHEKIQKEYKGKVKVLTNHKVLRVQESQIQVKLLVNCQASHIDEKSLFLNQYGSQMKVLSADKIIVAIAPNHYKKIQFSDDQSLAIKQAVQHLYPSNMFKIAVLLDTSLHAKTPIFCTIETSNSGLKTISFTPETENSKILVGLLHTNLLGEKEKVVKALELTLLLQGIRILNIKKPYYETGESWFTQKKGFLPLINDRDSRLVYLGAVTGCCDAVHSVLINTCMQLNIDPKALEEIFPGPRLRTQVRQSTQFY